MFDSSFITLRKEAIKNNIRFLRGIYKNEVKISAVVKANAYGHGIEQMVPLLEEEGIDHFSVFDFIEATRVHNSLTQNHTIMIMGWVHDSDLKEAIKRGFDFFVFNLERLKLALKYAKELNTKANIHIEAETGMNRSGFGKEQLKKTIEIINTNKPYFNVKGFCTHLAGAESISNHLRIQNQIKKYQKLLGVLESKDIHPECLHIANSAASIVYPKTRLDMVRVGIMLYGFWPSMETFIHFTRNKTDKEDPLNRILGWRSKIMSIKEVKTGEFIGYGISYLAQRDLKTALIPIGYSDGFSRSLSNKGRLLINGQICEVIGVVNMNMIIADISHLPDAKIGDEVTIIGIQGDLEIKVSSFSNISDKLNYEILAHMPENIERKII